MPYLIIFNMLFATASWQQVKTSDGMMLQMQQRNASKYENLRVIGSSKVSAETFALAWWGKADDISDNEMVKKREVLLDNGDRRIFYDVVKFPVGSDREYVMAGELRRNTGDGSFTLRFKTIRDARKPVNNTRIRMEVQATVVVTPQPQGGSRFVYTVFTDLGGSMPIMFTRRPQRNATLKFAQAKRRRAEKRSN